MGDPEVRFAHGNLTSLLRQGLKLTSAVKMPAARSNAYSHLDMRHAKRTQDNVALYNSCSMVLRRGRWRCTARGNDMSLDLVRSSPLFCIQLLDASKDQYVQTRKWYLPHPNHVKHKLGSMNSCGC